MKKSINNRGYVSLTGNGKQYLEHRYVWEQANGKIAKGMEIHHINSNKQDNRLENLALVTKAENMSKSDYWGKGYRFEPRMSKIRPYYATRAKTHLGNFGTPCGAHMAHRMYYITHG
tara:strand:+ start:90 stop:440 length:351 start_codon:yes stop_codon:yes gene_type:complete